MNARTFFPAVSLLLLLAGCHGRSSARSVEQQRADQRAEVETQREQLAMIPPPSKNRFMAIRTFESWQNPYITVQADMLDLHVLLADANTTDIGAGGLMRPVGARRQDLNISLDKLGDAVNAIPQSAWPYGRVIAIEEAHKTPASAEPAVRRMMEGAVSRLNDLGIEAYDVNDGNLR